MRQCLPCPDLWLLQLQVFSVLDGEVDVLQHDVHALLICPVKGQEAHHAVVVDLDTHTQIAALWSHTARLHSTPIAPLINEPTHQAADGLSQLLEFGTPDGVRAVLHHGVHVWVQVPAQHTLLSCMSILQFYR